MNMLSKHLPTVTVMIVLFTLMAITTPMVSAKELTVMHCWTPPRNTFVDEMAKSFSQQYPGVTVKTLLISSCTKLQESFLTAHMGGVSPDVVMIRSADIPASVDSGILTPLTERMIKDNLKLDMWFPSEIESSRWQGDIYGLPIRTGGDANSLMFYNMEILENAGYGAPPKTWDELGTMSRRLVQYNETGLVRAPILPQGGDLYSTAWLAAGGGSLYSTDGKTTLFGNQTAISATDYLQQLFTRVYRGGLLEAENAMGTTQAKRREAFISGKLAFNFEGSWEFTMLKSTAPNLRYGVTLRPTLTQNGKPGIHAGTYHYAVPRGVADPALAWELVKWLTTKQDTAGSFMLQQDRPSPVISFSRNRRYWDINPYWPVVIDALQKVDFLPAYPFTDAVSVIFGDALRAITRGQSAAATALEEAARRAQTVIDDYWKKK